MLTKIFSILKLLANTSFYRELARWAGYYYYEHAIPISRVRRGENVYIHPTVSLRFGENIKLGNDVIIEANCCLWASENSKVSIGNNSGIAYGTMIISSNHGFFKLKSYTDQSMVEKDIVIEDDVFVGANCVIMAGVTLGEGSVIGAGTVVSKNIAPYSIVVGKSRDLSVFQRR